MGIAGELHQFFRSSHIVHIGDEHHDGAQLVDIDSDGDLDVISIGKRIRK